MTRPKPKHPRILAVSPSTRGFGFALIEGKEILVDWGVKSVERDKNARCLEKIEELISHYNPEVLILHDHAAKDSRRAPRIRKLGKVIIALAKKHKVTVRLFSLQQVKRAILANGEGTKHEIAELLANRFPEELGLRLPPKRRPWESEDSRMGIFDAVALALVPRLKQEKRTAEESNRTRGVNDNSARSADEL